jgi:hypothetical protein
LASIDKKKIINQQSMEEDKKNNGSEIDEISFSQIMNNYIKNLNSLYDIFPLIIKLVSTKMLQESKHVEDFIDTNGIKEENASSNGDGLLLIPEESINQFIKLAETLETSRIAYEYLPNNFIVSFVSQYDAFIGCLIKTMFLVKPELLNGSEKNILFSELVEFENIIEARDFIIEKEIESVIRESHLKQFKWLESKLNMKLREDLPSFVDFLEITERRNLFVHCNGVVSRQYLENCKSLKVPEIENIKVGERLNVKPAYFIKCYSVLFEIGIKLGQVIWRKLVPNQLEDADNHLNDICYKLLIKGNYRLALNFLSFATDILKKHFDQETICIFMINKALAFYLAGKKMECKTVLGQYDWSATSDTFKLAISVLNEEYLDSISIMKKIGPDNVQVSKRAYREWPLFKKFRHTEEFKNTYKEIFGEEIVYIEPKPRKLEDILSELKEVKKEIERETNDSQEKI